MIVWCVRAVAANSSHKMGGKYLIIISSGTSDATKVHVGVTNGFALLAGDATNKVDFVLMAEGGWVDQQQSETPSTSELQEEPSATEAERQPSPQEPQEDLQGHYIGPASGVSFLLRVQKRLHQAIAFSAPSSIFTFGDAPLQPPDFDPSFCMVLPRDDAQRLFDRYFDFAMPTYRFLHRPTLQEWFVEFYDTLGTMRDGNSSACAKIALLFMIFAHARVYMPENDRPGPTDLRYASTESHI